MYLKKYVCSYKLTEFASLLREQYDEWKSECQKMVPVVGSGKFLTTPIVTDDGQPIEDTPGTHGDQQGNQDPAFEKKVIQWKQVLPQIGMQSIHNCFYFTSPPAPHQTNKPLVIYWELKSVSDSSFHL